MRTTNTRKMDRFEFRPTPAVGKMIGLYIRVSSNEFARNEAGERERRASVTTQTQDAIGDAIANGWDYKIYDQDCDVSGSEELADRPALQQLKKDIEAGKIHTVSARAMDRLFRNSDLQSFFRNKVFLPHGVGLRLLSDKSFNWFSESGNLVSAITGIQNQDFLIKLSVLSRRSKIKLAEEGKLRTPPAYGYGVSEIDGVRKTYIKPNEAKIIEEVFARCIGGEGTYKISQELNCRGIKPRRGRYFPNSTIACWLRNPTYKGVLDYNGTEYKSPYEPIVTPEVWQKANDAIGLRKDDHGLNRRRAANSHLLTGLTKCGYCVTRLDNGETATYTIYPNMIASRNRSKNGNIIPTYFCQTRYKNHPIACPEARAIRAVLIEDFVVDHLRDLVVNRAKSGGMEKRKQLFISQISQKENEIKKLKERSEKSLKMYGSGVIDEDAMLTIRETAKVKIQALGQAVETLKNELAPMAAGTVTVDTINGWEALSLTEQKKVVGKLIEKILVYKDRVEIYPRANPETPTVAHIGGTAHKPRLEIGPVTSHILKTTIRSRLIGAGPTPEASGEVMATIRNRK